MNKKYLMFAFLPLLMLANPSRAFEMDHSKIMGADECGECHKDEVKVWRETKHYRTCSGLINL